MQGARVLITGGAGLIGSTIADQLLDCDVAEIVVLDDFSRGRRANLAAAMAGGRVTLIEGDIRDAAVVARGMAGIDLLFHQAALRITQCAAEPRLAMQVLADGTFNVLQEARAAGVRKVIAASSASVYGMAEHFPTAEDHHPYGNRTLYGAAKAFNEGLLRSFHDMYGLDYVALRYFNVYGPRMDAHGAYVEVFIRWMQRIAAGQPPLIFGDGCGSMDLVHVHDVARANLLAARSAISDEVFNIGSGRETTLDELARALLATMGSTLLPEYGPERAINAVPRRVADTRKAARLLDFMAQVGLAEGLTQLVAWWRGLRLAP
ncbi:MAG: NAD-dependent epimerase/dehydratase family protein [bacterium]